MKIHHTCMCGAEIELNSTQSHDQLRCPDCGMALVLGEKAFSAESTVETTTASAPVDHPDLFPHADTASIDRTELLGRFRDPP